MSVSWDCQTQTLSLVSQWEIKFEVEEYWPVSFCSRDGYSTFGHGPSLIIPIAFISHSLGKW